MRRLFLAAALAAAVAALAFAQSPDGGVDRAKFVRFADFGTERDFDALQDIYFPKPPENYWLWGINNPSEFIRYETPTRFYWVTKPRNAANYTAARVISNNYSAKVRIKAPATHSAARLVIRYKDNLTQPTSVEVLGKADWKPLGKLGGQFDHQWKAEKLVFNTRDATDDGHGYVIRIGRGDYGDLRGDLPIDWIGLSAGEVEVPPPAPGFWPLKLVSRFGDLGKTMRYAPNAAPAYIAGVMVKGMRRDSWKNFARDHVNGVILQGWETQWKRQWETYRDEKYHDRIRAGFPDWLEVCAENKLWCSSQFFTDTRSYWIQRQYGGEEAALDTLYEVMKFNKNAPGNLGWYLKDEADHTDPTWGAPPEFVLQLYNLQKKADPDRAAIVLFQGWKNGAYQAYDGAFDVAAFDVYPLGAGREVVEISDRIERMRAEVGPEKALWAVVEGHDGEHVRLTKKRLTAAETLVQGYLCLAHDIHGVIYFVDNEAAYIDVGDMPEPWAGMKQFFAEVNGPGGLAPWLLPDAKTIARTGVESPGGPDSDAIHFIHKRKGAANLAITVNTRRVEKDNVALSFDGLAPGANVKVLFENRVLKAGATGVVDSFRGYERHVYAW